MHSLSVHTHPVLFLTIGTTMAGLAANGHQLDFDHYHAHVHGSLDYQSLLSAQPETRRTLADLALQKHILTNADAKHTAVCLERLGLTDCFQVSTGGGEGGGGEVDGWV